MNRPGNLSHYWRVSTLLASGILASAGGGLAQSPTDPELMRKLLERVERLEKLNEALASEIRGLREELSKAPLAALPSNNAAAPAATVEERVDIAERRIAEHADTKIEASQRFPVKLTGMALFNIQANSRFNGGSDNPAIASNAPGARTAGATFRQTVIGLTYDGPRTVWDGRVKGSLYMDFFGGSAALLNHLLRIRTATFEIDWKTRSFMVGQEKPIFAPREPNSLSQVGISPLTGAGNLWLWLRQARIEQRVQFGDSDRLKIQAGIVQTNERGAYQNEPFVSSIEAARPSLEGRFEWSHRFANGRRLEIAPGFHASTTHVGGQSAPSNIFSMDWFFDPLSKLQFTGAYFRGSNVAHLGTGGIRQGFFFRPGQGVVSVDAMGGWSQVTWLAAPRVTVNAFAGIHQNESGYLAPNAIGRNFSFGANLMYRLAPNVLVGLESTQIRTTYLGSGTRLHNHYDLAFAYLF